jgi:hypothetical protein
MAIWHVFYRNGQETESEPTGFEFSYAASLASEDVEDVFRRMNVVDGDELPVVLGIRSMSVGDIALQGDVAHVCEPAGWRQIVGGPVVLVLLAKPKGQIAELDLACRYGAKSCRPGRRCRACSADRHGERP